jgi:hypothetical protein
MNAKHIDKNYSQPTGTVKFSEEPNTIIIKELWSNQNVSLDAPPLDFSNMEIQNLESKIISHSYGDAAFRQAKADRTDEGY